MLDWLHSNKRITSQQCHEEAQAILLAPTQETGQGSNGQELVQKIMLVASDQVAAPEIFGSKKLVLKARTIWGSKGRSRKKSWSNGQTRESVGFKSMFSP